MKRTALLSGVLLLHGLALAQMRMEPGRSIGTITTQGDLIVMELNEGALGRANMFDLAGRTIRFTPDGAGYRAENLPVKWDAAFGEAMSGPQAKLQKFSFPFSGKTWDSFSVGVTGSIAFGEPRTGRPGGAGGAGNRAGGVSIGRFDPLAEAGRALINTVPAICVFMKPRMSGTRHFKELEDRAVITWDLTEPVGGIQDFTWVKTVNRFQAVLFRGGAIEMSYQQLAAKDAIVGVYPLVAAGVEKPIAALKGEGNPALAAHLDVRGVRVSAVDGLFLKVALETRGPVLAAGDPAVAGVTYRVHLDRAGAKVVWTIRGMGAGRGGRAGRTGGGTSRYMASGPGVAGGVTASGNTIALQGTLPKELAGTEPVAVWVEAQAQGGPAAVFDKLAPRTVALAGIRAPELDLSSVKKEDGPFAVAYEAFHYLALPGARDLTCTVIKALGDKFDLLAYYSDFRIDNQEAGTPSTGPLGGNVTGIGQTQRNLESYCSAGRFQWQYVQPVYAGSNQMQERPPEGVPADNPRNIAFYDKQMGERSPDGKMLSYNLAMAQLAHEMGHRWSAFVSAKVNGETIELGPTHWARGLHAPVAFPYQRPTEASTMGGSVWQDNFDGTFTQLDDDYYVPSTGWSYLDLYLMGMISAKEVPDFFMLRNLVPAGKDANGHPIFKADRVKVTINDVIAAEGPRLPDVDHAQKKFNTGMVIIVEHGKKPSRELIERTNAIAGRWIDFWETTTGHRSSMTTSPR